MITIKPFGALSWIVEVETIDDIREHMVNFNPFSMKFVCDCTWNVFTDGKECKHIRCTKRFIVNGENKFDEC